MVILAFHGVFSKISISGETLAWGIAAAVGLAFYSLIPTNIIMKFGTIPVTGFGMLIGSISLVPFVRPWSWSYTFDVSVILALMGMVLVGTVFAYTMYIQGVKDIGAVKASMIACVEPVSATLLSFFWLKTPFAAADILGFVFVISAVILLSTDKK